MILFLTKSYFFYLQLIDVIKNTLFYGSFFFIGIFFIDTILELASHPYDFLIAVGMFLGFVYLYRDNKESLFLTLKDTHQSNLDDIEEQDKEEII